MPPCSARRSTAPRLSATRPGATAWCSGGGEKSSAGWAETLQRRPLALRPSQSSPVKGGGSTRQACGRDDASNSCSDQTAHRRARRRRRRRADRLDRDGGGRGRLPGAKRRRSLASRNAPAPPLITSRSSRSPTRELGGKRPVLALTPGVGDIDIAVASELLEAGRVVASGFVHARAHASDRLDQPLLCHGREDRHGRRPLRPGQTDQDGHRTMRATRCSSTWTRSPDRAARSSTR